MSAVAMSNVTDVVAVGLTSIFVVGKLLMVWCETRTKGERAQLRSWDSTRLPAVIAGCAYNKCLRQWYADGVLGPADRYLH